MAALVEHGQLQLGVGDCFGHRQHPLEALDGLVRAEDHAETLARQVQELRVVRAQFHQPIEHRLGLGDLEARAQGAAGIHERDQVLGILLHCLLEQGQRLVEAVELPQRARLLKFRDIHPQAGNDTGGPLRRWDQSRVAKLLMPVLGHGCSGAWTLWRGLKQTPLPKAT